MTATVVCHTLRTGTGTPLVLLHAFPVDHRMWVPLAALLPGTGPVLAVDLPGMGASPVPGPDTGDPTLDDAADAVATAVRAAGHSRAVVAGLSMGGYVTLALAERHPDLLAGLALLDTKSVPDQAAAVENRLRVAATAETTGSVDVVLQMATGLLGADNRSARPDLVARMTGWITDQRPEGIAWSQRAMAARGDRTAVLRGWDRPALVVVGDQDDAAPVEQAQHMAEALRIDPVVVVGAGHMTAVEAPAEVAAALGDLVARSGTV